MGEDLFVLSTERTVVVRKFPVGGWGTRGIDGEMLWRVLSGQTSFCRRRHRRDLDS